MVDYDGSETIDAEEFAVVLHLLQGRSAQPPPPPPSASSSPSAPKAASCPSGLLVAFFGPDQKGLLRIKDFSAFLERLHEEVVRLEFEHYLPDVRVSFEQL